GRRRAARRARRYCIDRPGDRAPGLGRHAGEGSERAWDRTGSTLLVGENWPRRPGGDPRGADAAVTDDRLRRFILSAFVLGLAVSITLAEVALVALAVRLVYRAVRGRARVEGWPLAWPFAVWIAISLVAAAVSPEPLVSL